MYFFFLPVHHTHEDIDAVYSVFSGMLSRCDAKTQPDMMNKLASCFKYKNRTVPTAPERPVIELLTEVVDYKSFVDKYVPEGSIQGQTYQQAYRFQHMPSSNEVGCWSKQFDTDSDWVGPIFFTTGVEKLGEWPKWVVPHLVPGVERPLRGKAGERERQREHPETARFFATIESLHQCGMLSFVQKALWEDLIATFPVLREQARLPCTPPWLWPTQLPLRCTPPDAGWVAPYVDPVVEADRASEEQQPADGW